ncbi:ubiquinone biosynthesis accessory factor UbiJ [Enterovibrio paralichthyis]|uniref:ubiquinone biosynthesis accessory factor UbiJ n=1 Tax=Enterovibrio paralichthyis TaxID=2853805 RepID=UPI001C4709E4|nr:SCP2 domain-containing protein [Enterovibrio paralichthyis]MBV7300441.1 SCP2 domain-containing protein [Enterovibrio paralichthyis]
MPLDPLVTAVVETSLNTLLKQDSESQRRLARLKGKVLRVRLTDINKQLVFVFSQQIDVLAAFEGDADCELALAISVAPQLKDKANLTSLIKQDKLHLEGDIDVAQQFSNLLNGLNPDIAEWLSHYTGDVVAHTLVRGAQQGLAFIKQVTERNQRYVGELVVEEWRLAPGALEVAYFADQVDEVQSQASRLQARIDAFEKTLATLEVERA